MIVLSIIIFVVSFILGVFVQSYYTYKSIKPFYPGPVDIRDYAKTIYLLYRFNRLRERDRIKTICNVLYNTELSHFSNADYCINMINRLGNIYDLPNLNTDYLGRCNVFDVQKLYDLVYQDIMNSNLPKNIDKTSLLSRLTYLYFKLDYRYSITISLP